MKRNEKLLSPELSMVAKCRQNELVAADSLDRFKFNRKHDRKFFSESEENYEIPFERYAV